MYVFFIGPFLNFMDSKADSMAIIHLHGGPVCGWHTTVLDPKEWFLVLSKNSDSLLYYLPPVVTRCKLHIAVPSHCIIALLSSKAGTKNPRARLLFAIDTGPN